MIIDKNFDYESSKLLYIPKERYKKYNSSKESKKLKVSLAKKMTF